MKGWSFGSMSEVIRSAASASVRATIRVGTPITSAARRAAISFCTASWVGTSTLPPMWPHFFTEASWSSKCTPAAPASIIDFISSKAFEHAAEAGFGVGDDRLQPVDAVVAFGVVELVGAQQRVVDALDHLRHRVGRIQRLVRIHLAGDVGVGGDLPAGQVDRVQAGLDLLHGLVAGERAERVDEGLFAAGSSTASRRRGAPASARSRRCRAGAPLPRPDSRA